MRHASPSSSAPWRVLLALALAAVLLIASACSGDDDTGGVDDPAPDGDSGGVTSFIPAGSPGYFEIDTDLDGEQWTLVQELVARFPDGPDIQAELEEGFEEEESEVSFEEVREVLGDRAAIAITELPPDFASDLQSGGGAEDPGFIAVVEIADGQEDALRELLTREDFAPVGEAEGAEILADDDDTFIAITGGVAVIGETQESVAAALAANAEGGAAVLAGDERYGEALGALAEETFAEGYFDLGAIIGQVAAEQPELQQLGVIGDYQDTVVAASIAAEDEGVRIEGVITGAPEETVGTNFSPELLDRVPADAFAYIGVSDLAGTIGGTLSGLEGDAGEQVQQQLEFLSAQLESQLNVSVDDLAALAGGEHAFIVAGDAMAPAVAAVLSVEDGARAKQTLDSLREATPLITSMLGTGGSAQQFRPVELENGVEGFQLPIMPGVAVTYGVDGDLAIIASNDEIVRQIQSPTDALPGSEDFQAGTEGIPDEVSALFWINSGRILEAVNEAGLLDDEPAGEVANLEPVRSIAGWGESGDIPSFTLFVRITE